MTDKEIYLSNLEWTKTHDNMGGVKGDLIFKDNISYEEYKKILKETYFILSDKRIQSNWNSLREYTEERLKVLERRINTFGTINPDKDSKVLQIYQGVLDKMNELEGKEK